ncbi:hypothetical protein DPMN_136544 [Dreissena polymorpha]|uniref:Uncharacterized protein n=1 Tax=Dreissena polymorpha TaxID=45954 RepID=A0A9D4JHX7_DREPO|nr:hypothetical protein DPMN_136544 [Dreissena polymorpha]
MVTELATNSTSDLHVIEELYAMHTVEELAKAIDSLSFTQKVTASHICHQIRKHHPTSVTE